jgi:predicted branched-subunit amino acid permease
MPSEDGPAWAQRASPAEALLRGLTVAATAPGIVLVAGSFGFGALARDSGFDAGQAAATSLLFYALPAQVVLADQLARGAGLLAAAFAVSLTAIRLLPMTVTLIPYVKNGKAPGALYLLVAHFVAVTAWIEGQRRLPLLPGRLRLWHFLGLGTGMLTMTLTGTLLGFFASASVPSVIAAAFLFMTPLYFLLSLIGTARNVPDRLAVALGAALGVPLYLLIPGFDLLASGLVGGTAAFLSGRGRP